MALPASKSLGLALLLGAVLLFATPAAEAKSDVLDDLLKSTTYQEVSKLLIAADLLDDLENLDKPLTFFLPTDSYVTKHVNPRLLEWLKRPENIESLQKVLKFHVTIGKFTYADFTAPPVTFPSLDDGAPLHITFGQKNLKMRLLIESSPLKRTDYMVEKDGAVHGIDGFLLPPSVLPLVQCPVLGDCGAPAPAPAALTITEILLANGYTDLVSTLQAAGIDKDVDKLKDVTVLAPTNAALKSFLASLTPEESKQLPKVLKWILFYHVLQGYHPATKLLMGGSYLTYKKDSSVVTTTKLNVVYINPDSTNAKLVEADIQADGITSVQGIDKVLVPSDLFTMGPSSAPFPSPMDGPGTAPAPSVGAAPRSVEASFCMLLLLAVAGFAALF